MTAVQPDERRFYLDDANQPIRSRQSWIESRGGRITHGVIGGLLLLPCAYELATDGLDTELFVYTNALLGLGFIAQAFNTRLGNRLFGGSPERPFLALHADGVTVHSEGRERTFTWGEVTAVEKGTSRLLLVPHEGAPVTIPYTDLSYERVQEVKAELFAAASDHGVRIQEDEARRG